MTVEQEWQHYKEAWKKLCEAWHDGEVYDSDEFVHKIQELIMLYGDLTREGSYMGIIHVKGRQEKATG